jgi:type I restriction enzyme S subunit
MAEHIETTLGEIAKVVTGKTPPTKRAELYGDKYPFITPTDIQDGCRYCEPSRFLSEDGALSLKNNLIPKNTISYTCIASIGKICITKEDSFTNQQINSLIVDEKKAHYLYVFYWLIQNTEFIKKSAGGTTTNIINKTDFSKVKIKIPRSLEIQKEIAHMLSVFDEKIEVLRKENQSLEELAQALYKRWFVEFNFPDESGKPYRENGGQMIDSELGLIPKGWRVGKLGEVVKVSGGGTPSTKNSEFWNGNISWTSPRDLSGKDDRFLHVTSKKITNKGLEKISSPLYPKNTLLLSSRAPIGYLVITNIETAINQGYIAFIDHYFSNKYMFLWLRNNMDLVNQSANGATFKEISKTAFKEIKAVIPEKKSLNKLELVIVDIFEKIRVNEEQIQALTETKERLLSKLI